MSPDKHLPPGWDKSAMTRIQEDILYLVLAVAHGRAGTDGEARIDALKRRRSRMRAFAEEHVNKQDPRAK